MTGLIASGGAASLRAPGGGAVISAGSASAALSELIAVQVTHRTWVQSSPSSLWVVNHDLGYRPLVQVFDGFGALVLCDIEHDVAGLTFAINLNTPMSGTAEYE